MALAFCLQSRVYVAMYIVALQRHAQDPTAEHIRRLNAIVLSAIKHPVESLYRFMKRDRKFELDSDAAFRREGAKNRMADSAGGQSRVQSSFDGQPCAEID